MFVFPKSLFYIFIFFFNIVNYITRCTRNIKKSYEAFQKANAIGMNTTYLA